MVPGDDQGLDGAVREAHKLGLRHAQLPQAAEGVLRHELVAQSSRTTRGPALCARVEGDNGVSTLGHGVDHGSKDAVLLAVAM